MENKISTSIQYQLTNKKLFYDIFGNFEEFNEILKQGSNAVKQFLLDDWNEIKEELSKNENIVLKDIDKKVTIDDFDIELEEDKDGYAVFFFTFPDYEDHDAASKYIALCLLKDRPRYITLEYGESFVIKQFPEKESCFMIGEFSVDENSNIVHQNYGKLEGTLKSFKKKVMEIINS